MPGLFDDLPDVAVAEKRNPGLFDDLPDAQPTQQSTVTSPYAEFGQADEQAEIERRASGEALPEWAQKTAKAAAKVAKGFVEPLVPTYVGGVPMLNPQGIAEMATPVVGGVHEAVKQYQILQDVYGNGMSMEEATRKNTPEAFALAEAEKTPAGSQERYDAGLEMLANFGMAGLIGKGMVPKRSVRPAIESEAGPKVVEPKLTTKEAAKADVPDNQSMARFREVDPLPSETAVLAESVPSTELPKAESQREVGEVVSTDLPEVLGNRISADTKGFSSLTETPAFREKGLSGLDIPSQRAVMERVIAASHDPQVRQTIIESIPVDVVDNLVSLKPSTEVLLHDQSVLPDLFVFKGEGSVSIRSDVADSLVRAVASHGAKSISAFPGAGVSSTEGASTFGAGKIHEADIIATSKPKQEIPEGTVLPNGGEYRFDQKSGKNFARWEKENLPSVETPATDVNTGTAQGQKALPATPPLSQKEILVYHGGDISGKEMPWFTENKAEAAKYGEPKAYYITVSNPASVEGGFTPSRLREQGHDAAYFADPMSKEGKYDGQAPQWVPLDKSQIRPAEQAPSVPSAPAANTEGGLPPKASESVPTSTKNSVTALEREQRGIPAAEEAARRDFGEVWSQAEQLAKEQPEAGRALVTELTKDNGVGARALTDKENALLLRRQIEVQNEHSAAVEALNAAPDNPALVQRLEIARNELQAVYDAAKNAGTETARGLNARKMLANQDFTLARMEAETRAVANAGRPLSPKQTAEVKGLWERINKAESKLAEYEAMGDFRKSVQVARRTRNKPFSVTSFLDEKAVAARERIVSRRGKLYADPLGVTNVAHLADEAIIGASHIARGVKNLKDWSAVMIKEFGDGIKPYLKALFAKSQGLHSEAARLAAAKARTVTQTVQTMSKIGRNDFEPRKVEPVKPDRELAALQGNLQRAKDIYFKRLWEAKQANRPIHSKAIQGVVKTINTSRALKTSGDISAVGRQGGWIGAGHPILAAKNIKPMFEAMRSPEGQYRIEAEIKAHPDYALAKQSKLELTEISDTASMTKAEEAYMNSWADKIPGVAGSQRAYVTYLNKLRMDTFGQLVRDLGKTGKVTPIEAKILANYVNVATGRGFVGKWAGAFSGMNNVFFAPRYVLSRFQLLLGQPLVHQLGKGSPRVRAMIAKEYARSLAGTATVIGLGVAAGAAFNVTDPTSPDFLKLKFGNTRLDPFYGLQQTLVFLNRAGYNVLRSSRGEKIPYMEQNAPQRFVRSKLAPAYGSGLNMITGTDFMGQPTTFQKEAINMIDPIAREDIIKAFQEHGVEKGAALSMLSLLGMGMQTYAPKESKSSGKPKAEKKPDLKKAMHQRKLSQVAEYLGQQAA